MWVCDRYDGVSERRDAAMSPGRPRPRLPGPPSVLSLLHSAPDPSLTSRPTLLTRSTLVTQVMTTLVIATLLQALR